MEEEKTPVQETPAPEPAKTPEAAAAPLSKEESKAQAKEQAAVPEPEEEVPLVGNVLLFGKYDVSGVTLRDAGMARYIDVTPVSVPHTGGRHTSKAFGKAKMGIVERLINNMMRTEDFTGKKMKSYKAVEDAFGVIERKTKQNPLQMLVDALQNAAPREEVTRLQY